VPIASHPAFKMVMDDVVAGLAGTFSPREEDDIEPFRVAERFKEADVISNASVVAVPWSFSCRHTGDFHGLFRTGRDLQIEGMTLVDSRGGAPMLHRYVDWLGVIAQLGLEVSGRIPVTEAEYEFGREHSE
jgi:predicted ester cyclase